MTQYFSECKTLEEAKRLYKELARKNHPDMGGDLRTMKEINAQFSQYQARSATNEARERQHTAHADEKMQTLAENALEELENI